MGIWQYVEILVDESISTITGLPPGSMWLVKKLTAEDDEETGKNYRCGLCGEENDHYKTTCPEKHCSNCPCDNPDCSKYDDGAACDCCI